MPDLLILGTAASVPDAEHDTIGLALCGPGWAVQIECTGSPLYKLARMGVKAAVLRAVVLTHGHADHLYGMPMLIQGLWLGGRKAPLPVYGPAEALSVARCLLQPFDLVERPGMFSLEWHPIPLREGERVLEIEGVRITAAPVEHLVLETLALRFEDRQTGRAAVYSADTQPCPAVVRLATGANLLLHEANGSHPGHSSPEQAAEVAQAAGVEQLILIHYPVHGVDLEAWRARAARFPGPVTLARDGERIPF